ncbi:MAG: hypothetical protein WBH77_09900 [Saccharofermentanales bacterium]
MINIEVFNDNKSEIIIDQFKSLILQENFLRPNSFSLVLNFKYKYIIKPDTYFLIENKFYYVDRVESDGLNIRIAGKGLAQLADRQIIKGTFIKSAKPTIICKELCNNYVTYFDNQCIVSSPDITETIQYQKSYGNILEEVTNLCLTYDFGFVEEPTNLLMPSCKLIFHSGNDVSANVEFSVFNDNLIAENYENINYNYKNVAYVYGEGEGTARKNVIVNDHITGLNRRELYVDARDLQQGNLTDAAYLNLLRMRGRQKLAEYQKSFKIEGFIDINDELFKYGIDYKVGDFISVNSKKFNLKRKQRLISMVRTWDRAGFHMDPVFDFDAPIIFLRR